MMPVQTLVESGLKAEAAVYSQIVKAGDYWIHEIAAGQVFRIVDLKGNQAVDTLFYNARETSERYSAVDTISRQGDIYLTSGSVLRSNLGNPMLTITADTCGRHDTLGGACATESNQVRYAVEKRHMHACRRSFLLAVSDPKWNLTKRDLAPNINFFMNVPVTPDGKLTFEDGISEAGKYVEMQASMDVICVISNCPQLNNPCNAYNPTPIQVLIWNGPPA
jgi:urea carboxylase-associated protein 1